MLTISQMTGRENGDFKNWSIAQPRASNNNDHPCEPTPIAVAVPAVDEPILAPPEQPHRPWLVPGRNTL